MNDARQKTADKLDLTKLLARRSWHETTRWRIAVVSLAVLFTVLFTVYWQTASSIVQVWWRSETFAHGFFIIPISLYMIWTRRRSLIQLSPRPCFWGVSLLLAFSIGWLLGNLANVVLVQHLALAGIIGATAFTVLGRQVTRAISFPLAYLIFAVPFGEFLISPLMDWTAWFTVRALQLTGVPVYTEGRFITVPTAVWEVAEVCSGLRYLIASLAVGCLYAYLMYRSHWRRLAFIALSAMVPILANGIRAYGIIMIGHLSDMRLAKGVDHIIYGWVFFGVVIFILFWIGSYWRESEKGVDSVRRPVAVLEPNAQSFRGQQAAFLVAVIAVGVAIAPGPAVAAWLNRGLEQATDYVVKLPAGSSGWRGPISTDERWEAQFPSAQHVRKIYKRGSEVVHVYLVYYPVQRQGQELIGSQVRIYDGKYWRRKGAAARTVRLRNDLHLNLRETAMSSPLGNRIVWHWYDIRGHKTPSPWLGKLWESWSRLLRKKGGSSMVMVSADYETYPDDARRQIQNFLSDMPAFYSPPGLVEEAFASSSSSLNWNREASLPNR